MAIIKKRIKDFKVCFNPDDNGIGLRLDYTNGNREPGFQWMISKRTTGTAFDIGANIGWISLLMSKTCDKIIAFEPDKRNYRFLVLNIYENNLRKKIFPDHRAITNLSGTCNMDFTKKPNLNTICTESGKPVSCVTIDKYCEETGVLPDVMKMDIEGGEVSAIKGGWKTITNKDKMRIFIEFHPEKYSPSNDFGKCLSDLVSNGYNIKWIENAKGKIGHFKKYNCIKKFNGFPRAIFKGVPNDKAIEMICTLDRDGKKIVRSAMIEKGRDLFYEHSL